MKNSVKLGCCSWLTFVREGLVWQRGSVSKGERWEIAQGSGHCPDNLMRSSRGLSSKQCHEVVSGRGCSGGSSMDHQ